MFKRFGILLNRHLRQCIQNDAQFCASPGMLEAFRFVKELIAMVLRQLPDGGYAQSEQYGGLQKWFTPGYTANDRLLKSFQGATRVRVVMSLRPLPSLKGLDQFQPAIQVDLMFFKEGQKRPFAKADVSFRLKDGVVVASGMRL